MLWPAIPRPRLFLSTLSLRRATLTEINKMATGRISIHALLAESDVISENQYTQTFYFYPRSPCGERRVTVLGIQHRVGISIHALLAESDPQISIKLTFDINFYPRSPCGERPIMDNIVFMPGQFLSTLSLRRATNAPRFTPTASRNFYPRSPCGERPDKHARQPTQPNFYPRSPCGERRVTVLGIQHRAGISIHALLAESDPTDQHQAYLRYQFLSTLSLRRATNAPRFTPTASRNFYPRSPCGERLRMICISTRITRFLSTLSLRRAT